MDHYDRCREAAQRQYEDSPAGKRAKRNRERTEQLRRKLKNVTLGEFTIGELEAVMRLFHLAHNIDPTEEQLMVLEKKAALLEQNNS